MSVNIRLIASLVIALVVTSCAGSAAPTGEASHPTSTPGRSPQSLQPATIQPSPEGSPATGDRLSGVLGADDIEGGCEYLRAADGTRYEVIYPDGWELRLSPLELRSPGGEVVARAGDEVTVVGRVADDMASICQIGPIFRATAVES